MKKLILIVLLSLVLSEKNKCKPNEIYKEEEKSCVEICKKDEYFNTETSTCEKCDEGQKYNQDKKECEDIKKQCKSNETWNDKMKRCVRNVIKCRNGRIERGRCRCNGGYRWVNGHGVRKAGDRVRQRIPETQDPWPSGRIQLPEGVKHYYVLFTVIGQRVSGQVFNRLRFQIRRPALENQFSAFGQF